MTKTQRWLKSAIASAQANPAPTLPWQRQTRSRPQAMTPPARKTPAIAAR